MSCKYSQSSERKICKYIIVTYHKSVEHKNEAVHPSTEGGVSSSKYLEVALTLNLKDMFD